jgi:hypothetical protein
MKSQWIAWSAVSTALLAGCGGTADIRDADPGLQQSDAKVAILFTPREGVYDAKARRAWFSAADGKAVGTFMKGFPGATRLAAGTYLFKVNCVDPTFGPRAPADLRETFMLFTATVQAGHFYELACDTRDARAIDRGTRFESVRDRMLPAAAEKLQQ